MPNQECLRVISLLNIPGLTLKIFVLVSNNRIMSRRYYMPQCTIDNQEACRRMGEAYKILMNWDKIVSAPLRDWMMAIAKSRNTPIEYIFLNLLPTIATMIGPQASLKVFPEYSEKPNTYMLLLREPGAGRTL